ncbi:hypothetical protein C8R44DRAFT_872019 [Mycena epipterygia]|nr:hypothetical protein C8R44DRAFT_872019 [Mycena epipterygia]
MLGFFSLWRRNDDSGLSPPRRVDKGTIGAPVLRSIPRRFEIYADAYTREPYSRSSSHRSGTTSLSSGTVDASPPPARSPPHARRDQSPYPLIRSYSLPTPACPPLSTPNGCTHGFFALAAARSNSVSPLLDLHRPLSPILETCVSPASLQPVSASPESEVSALDLSRPMEHPPPFLQRALSKTSGVSPSNAPSIPALNLTPPFPGPHPSQDGDGPPRRPPKARTLPPRSSVYGNSAAASSSGSLHAESFVTASNSMHIPATAEPLRDMPVGAAYPVSRSATSSTLLGARSDASQDARLERHGTLGSGGGSLRLKRQQRFAFATPAFCAFWLGFLFPPVWWVGGWYFTLFAETPEQRTLWEHYVAETRWWAVLTCGRCVRRGTARQTGAASLKPLLLPQWVGPNNTTASLKGISYYYPFVSRPAPGEMGHVTTGPPPPGFRRLHRLFDELTRSRLERVKLNRESPRRIIDPWIQRCRRALCYWCLAVLLFVLGMIGWSFAVGAGKAHY